MRVRAGATAAMVSGVLVLVAAVPAMAKDPGPDPSGPNGQSHQDGCTREPLQLIHGESPSWAYVYDDTSNPNLPAPRRMTGLVQTRDYQTDALGSPLNEAVHPSGDDLPSGHDDYDLNVDVQPDPQYIDLLGGHNDPVLDNRTGNFRGNGEDYAAVHSELQGDAMPLSLWPDEGDRIDLIGNWAWDCGHWGVPTEIFSPDYVLPKDGQPCFGSFQSLGPVLDPAQCHIAGESTEFHPWRAMWDIHAQSGSPTAAAEGLLYVSTYQTRAGRVEDCAHRNPPINGNANPLLKICVQNGSLWQDVTGDYSYYLPAPPRPSQAAHLTYHADDLGSAGAPAPTLAPEGDGVRVTFHLATAMDQALNMFYKVYAGWDDLPLATVPTHLQVHFDSLLVRRSMDCPVLQGEVACTSDTLNPNQRSSPPGEWNLYYNVQGHWGKLFGGEFDPSAGDILNPDQTVDVYVPQGQGWRMVMMGRECELQLLATGTSVTRNFASCLGKNTTAPLEISDSNDVPGKLLDEYASAQASLGTHVSDARTRKTVPVADPGSSCPPDPNPNGCYQLTYTVSEIQDAAARVLVPPPATSLPNTALASVAMLAALAALATLALALVLLPGRRARRR